MWTKYVTRRLAVQVAQAWNFGFGRTMQNVYGVSINNTLVYRDDKKTDYYVDETEFNAYVQGLYKLLESEPFIKTFHKDAQKVLEDILGTVQSACDQDLRQLSNEELLGIYTAVILPNQAQFYVRMWTVFNIGEPLATVVSRKLRDYVDDEKAAKLLLALSFPLVPNDVMNERLSLLRLALNSKNADFEKQLGEHWKRFKHIPMFDFDHEPYGLEHFRKEALSVKNLESELHDLEEQFSERKTDFEKALREIKPDTAFKNLLIFLKENVFLRDYRDMIRQKLNLSLRSFYAEVSRRLGLSVSRVAILTNDEIISCLRKGKDFPKSEIVEREKSFLLIQRGENVEIYSSDRAAEKARHELGAVDLGDLKIIKGITGATGKARGPVRLVFTNKDLGKVKEGDVLVATMTRQDFVTAIRRAVALVTDEGSVTAHSAIIARELKIPCIVATKIGTQILKDGDMVEVDAERGTVMVIKRKAG